MQKYLQPEQKEKRDSGMICYAVIAGRHIKKIEPYEREGLYCDIHK